MTELIRETPLGQLIRLLSRNHLLRYPEEEPDFKLPPQYITLLRSDEKSHQQHQPPTANGREVDGKDEDPATTGTSEHGYSMDQDLETLATVNSVASVRTHPYTNERFEMEQNLAELNATKSVPIAPQKTSDGVVLVDWYRTDDPANPQNWSSSKKGSVVFFLCLYTWTVYAAGPIYAASEPGVEQRFGVSPVAASLGLSLYVLAYGVGDLLFSPLSEIPIIGRNPIYYLTFIVYWVLSFPTAVQNSFGGLLALRFWLGFFGSKSSLTRTLSHARLRD
jgi:DHA1 family multidrug resistance protein-like MFS transporter